MAVQIDPNSSFIKEKSAIPALKVAGDAAGHTSLDTARAEGGVAAGTTAKRFPVPPETPNPALDAPRINPVEAAGGGVTMGEAGGGGARAWAVASSLALPATGGGVKNDDMA